MSSAHVCPSCQRSFGDGGFCPFDGTKLTDHSGDTQLSVAMPVAEPHKTDIEPHKTFPLGSTQQQRTTAPRVRVDSAPAKPVHVRALSASENPAAALEALRTRGNEYDRLVGQTLDGRYFIERKIGEGGMGVVFSARHAVIERPLAIKVLKREVMRDTATIRRFVQEAQAASRIGHPNIVDVTDFGTTPDGMTYSVMEFIEGTTLGTAIREAAPFSEQRAIRIAAQIARALGAAHDKGIVHRDLKPENVFLLNRDGRTDFVKIVDFGIAKVAPTAASAHEPRLTRAGSVFGTPEYMAPEQAAGRSDTDGRVDIYALGIILYEMITRKVPHRGDSTVRTLAMQMLDAITPPSQLRPDLAIRPALDELIMRALAKKRDQRFQTMGELLAAIDGLQTQVGTSVTGNPLYVLAPLPPGADPRLIPEPPAPHSAAQPSASADPVTVRSKRASHEPAFTDSDRPRTFEHVFATDAGAATAPRRRWPMLLLFALIAGSAFGALALVAKSRSLSTDSPRDASEVAVVSDAAVIAVDAEDHIDLPSDAAVIARVRDAGIPRNPDARTVAIRPAVDAGGGFGITAAHRGIGIQVLSKPDGAELYVLGTSPGAGYRGPGGTTLEEAPGTKLTVECRMRGYKPGKVELVFDGKTEYALCTLTRAKMCIGLPNPIDNCTDAGGSNLDPNKDL